MSAKIISELRHSGKLVEALQLAEAELNGNPDNIWSKRNISWVYYDYLKLYNSADHFDEFIVWLDKIRNLQLPNEEKMFYEQLCWQIGRMALNFNKKNLPFVKKISVKYLNQLNEYSTKIATLFKLTQSFQYPKPSVGYSFLFKAFHKSLKGSPDYIKFADWWGFDNFMSVDYETEQMPDGKKLMSIVEQAYISYAKELLTFMREANTLSQLFDIIHNSHISSASGDEDRAKRKVEEFLPNLSALIENHPEYQYPSYYYAKLLLALDQRDIAVSVILPFVKRKGNEFWVWELFAETFSDDPDKELACLCKALSCSAPAEMVVSLRQKMAGILISKKLYNEARTEIELLLQTRRNNGYTIPKEVTTWQEEEWYGSAVPSNSNLGFYRPFVSIAESLLFQEIPEENIIVEFVNSDKKMLHFIASELRYGFFKYDRFLDKVKIGDTLKVKFKGGSNGGIFQIHAAFETEDTILKNQFLKDVSGIVKIPPGRLYGFIDDIFINPSLIVKYKLVDGAFYSGRAIKSCNNEKKEWRWKLI